MIAFHSYRTGDSEIYLMNVDGSNQHNISNQAGTDAFPEWSPDGSKIVFYSSRTGDDEIFVMNADGTNQINLTNAPGSSEYAAVWSPID